MDDDRGQLTIVDIKKPDDPIQLSSLPLIYGAERVRVDGNYAYIAGVPINYGIYGSAVATIVGVLFTSSRFIVLGPTNATAIMLLSSFVSMDIEGEAKLALIPMLLVMTGMMRWR